MWEPETSPVWHTPAVFRTIFRPLWLCGRVAQLEFLTSDYLFKCFTCTSMQQCDHTLQSVFLQTVHLPPHVPSWNLSLFVQLMPQRNLTITNMFNIYGLDGLLEQNWTIFFENRKNYLMQLKHFLRLQRWFFFYSLKSFCMTAIILSTLDQ